LGLPEEEIPNVKFVSIKAFAGQAGWLLIDQAQLDERGFVFGNKRLEDKSQKPRRYLAREHFRLTWQDNQLVVEPLESLNGVYLKLRPGRKAPLHDGTWFVIGRHVVVFRTSQEEPTQSSPRIGPGNEVFLSRPLVVLAYLDFLGPDARPSITVPITKMDYTDLGRTGGNRCDIALPDDDWISSQHARIHHVNGTFLLEDLHSRNGTYIRMQEHTQLKLGSIQNEAAGDVILVGDLFLRFVEQQ
jgi:pSer/pThr/pTyr-binding forkhead associated (FHA) protein